MSGPRQTHWRSAEIAGQALRAARISHTTQYGDRDNVLFIIDGQEVPVSTSRLVRDVMVAPPRRWTKDTDIHLLVDPDAGVVEIHRKVSIIVVTLSADTGAELDRVPSYRWEATRLPLPHPTIELEV